MNTQTKTIHTPKEARENQFGRFGATIPTL